MKFLDPNALEQVKEFHNLFRCPVVDVPKLPSAERSALRVSLLKEELKELQEAIDQNDLIEVADALADIQYVLAGAILEFGMGNCFASLFNEVQRSNMSKACKTLEEAQLTQTHYKTYKGECTETFIEKIDETKWLVYRQSDRKALKSVNYSPTNLKAILDEAVTARTTGSFVMPESLSGVAEFHKLFKCPILETPQIPSDDRCKLRVSLLAEEIQELEDSYKANDLVEVADALADIQYVLSGAVLEFGMPNIFKNAFDEVHRSNMSKACQSPEEAEQTQKHYKENLDTDSIYEKIGDDEKYLVYRQGDRKALKSVNYSPANLGKFITA